MKAANSVLIQFDSHPHCFNLSDHRTAQSKPLCVLGAPAIDHATGLVVALSFAPSPPAAAHDIGTGVLLLHVQPLVANWALPNAQHTLAAPLFPQGSGGDASMASAQVSSSWESLRAFAAHRLVSVPVFDYAAVVASNNPCLSAAWLCARPHQGVCDMGRMCGRIIFECTATHMCFTPCSYSF